MAINLNKVVGGVPMKVWLIGGGVALVGGIIWRRRIQDQGNPTEPGEIADIDAGSEDQSGGLPTVALSGAPGGEDYFGFPSSPPPTRPGPTRRQFRLLRRRVHRLERVNRRRRRVRK